MGPFPHQDFYYRKIILPKIIPTSEVNFGFKFVIDLGNIV